MTAAPVLLVEDDDDHAALTGAALRRAGLTRPLVRARDGREALALLLGEGGPALDPPPDLVMLDLRLPDLDGRDVLGRLRGRAGAPEPPVVMLTASSPEDPLARRLADGADALLAKPARAADLLAAARRLGLGHLFDGGAGA